MAWYLIKYWARLDGVVVN